MSWPLRALTWTFWQIASGSRCPADPVGHKRTQRGSGWRVMQADDLHELIDCICYYVVASIGWRLGQGAFLNQSRNVFDGVSEGLTIGFIYRLISPMIMPLAV